VPLPGHTAQSGPRLIAAGRAKPLSEVIGPLKLDRITVADDSDWPVHGLWTEAASPAVSVPPLAPDHQDLQRTLKNPRTRQSGEDVRAVEGPSRPPGAPAPSPAALRHVSARARDPVDRAVGPDERSVGIVSRRVIVEGARREKRTPAHALTESSSSRSRAPPQTTDLNTGHAATPGVTTAPLGKRASPMSRSSRSLRTTRSCWRRRPDHARFRRRLRRRRRCPDDHREPVGRPRH
jgi:hypothetical protein